MRGGETSVQFLEDEPSSGMSLPNTRGADGRHLIHSSISSYRKSREISPYLSGFPYLAKRRCRANSNLVCTKEDIQEDEQHVRSSVM